MRSEILDPLYTFLHQTGIYTTTRAIRVEPIDHDGNPLTETRVFTDLEEYYRYVASIVTMQKLQSAAAKNTLTTSNPLLHTVEIVHEPGEIKRLFGWTSPLLVTRDELWTVEGYNFTMAYFGRPDLALDTEMPSSIT